MVLRPATSADENDMSEEFITGGGKRIPISELILTAVRASGPGGQKVNKTSSAIQLRFDIRSSAALTADEAERLLARPDNRLTGDGAIVIRAQRFRSQARNRDDAVARLGAFIDRGLATTKVRKATRPGKTAKEKRLREKARRSRTKALRRPPDG